MRTENLKATIQKSYYGKAHVMYLDNGCILLKSYDTIVCGFTNGKWARFWNGYSRTTMNHINDFRKAHGLPSINKKEWLAMECEGFDENSPHYKVEYSNGFFNAVTEVMFDCEYDAEKLADKMAEDSNYRISAWVIEC